jgi:D-alanine-D-alanine ligase
MDKLAAKRCVSALGVPVSTTYTWCGEKPHTPPFLPMVVKPVGGGSSIGLQILRSAAQWRETYVGEGMMCERYLPGREYSVAILEGRALPPVLIEPVAGEYDFAHKYTKDATREVCPAPLSSWERTRLQNTALLAFAALGLRDLARIDLREDVDGVPTFLEANTLPGMTQTSLFPLAAQCAGISFAALCERLAVIAATRHVG